MEGWLYKCSFNESSWLRVLAKWKRRYCVLSCGELSYFLDESKETIRGALPVTGAHLTLPSSSREYGKEFSFALQMGAGATSRTYVFASENESGRIDWLTALRKEGAITPGEGAGPRPVPPVSAQRNTVTGHAALKEGYLQRQGKWKKEWKMRYFVLTQSTLSYFVSQHDRSEPRWQLSLIRGIVAKETLEPGKGDFCLSVTDADDNKHYLLASSAQERDDWVLAIDRAIADVTYGRKRTPTSTGSPAPAPAPAPPSGGPARPTAKSREGERGEDVGGSDEEGEAGDEGVLIRGHLYALDESKGQWRRRYMSLGRGVGAKPRPSLRAWRRKEDSNGAPVREWHLVHASLSTAAAALQRCPHAKDTGTEFQLKCEGGDVLTLSSNSRSASSRWLLSLKQLGVPIAPAALPATATRPADWKTAVASVLGANPDALSAFTQCTDDLIAGSLAAQDYFRVFFTTLGHEAGIRLFPSLLAALPQSAAPLRVDLQALFDAAASKLADAFPKHPITDPASHGRKHTPGPSPSSSSSSVAPAPAPTPRIYDTRRDADVLPTFGPRPGQSQSQPRQFDSDDSSSDDGEESEARAVELVERTVAAWAKAHRRSLPLLLSTLHTVFPGISEGAFACALDADPAIVKRTYLRALMQVHPDKQPRNAPLPTQATAKAVFQTLSSAFEKFSTKGAGGT